MGIKKVRGRLKAPAPSGSLADALFTPVLQRVLARLYGQADRRFLSADLIRQAGAGTGATHRILKRLAASGLVTVTEEGRQKYYQANPASPIHEELRGLVRKTVGLVEPLREALDPLKARIEAAFVHGSVASGTDNGASDIDLLVITTLSQRTLLQAMDTAGLDLGRPLNLTVMSPGEWRDLGARADSFAGRVKSRPRLFVVGGPEDAGPVREPAPAGRAPKGVSGR